MYASPTSKLANDFIKDHIVNLCIVVNSNLLAQLGYNAEIY